MSDDKAFSLARRATTQPALCRRSVCAVVMPCVANRCSRCPPRPFASVCCGSASALSCCSAAPPHHSQPSFWNGQTGFSQTRLGPDKWQLEFVGNDLVSRETARKYVLKRAGEVAQAEGYQWLEVNELTLQRDAVRVTPSRPLFGFDDDRQIPFWISAPWSTASRRCSSSPSLAARKRPNHESRLSCKH